MELKDYLPLIGVGVGWLLSEGSAFGKRAIERKRTIGKAISILYFLCFEMIQLKMVQEKFKSASSDIKEWERLRQHSFVKYTVQDPEFFKEFVAITDAVGEYYPIEAYNLREIVSKYEFVKSKRLDRFIDSPALYIERLSSYETAFLAYQYQLEQILRFLAFRQSKVTWIRIRLHFWRMRKKVPKGDIVFFQQVNGRKERKSQQAPDDTACMSPDQSMRTSLAAAQQVFQQPASLQQGFPG
ncbi:hypothetical protein [Nitrosospira sp. Nsp1]|uniref:hypothetical protein n=1 Tax=Nitrosospira sp. Nsp1 TaxID=136547 RepID=UPI000883233A|nr:hypothetical protein [Nitrosospira sp. Nsp1]SCX62898.1 hypothetical protein SAMN05720354_13324 [Nitrosospira sp. Nsp1]